MSIEGKRMLFFSANAFGIPESIVENLTARGYKVDYYDERPSNSFFVKALIRINRNLIGQYINKYHESIIDKTKHNKYDYVFFIKGESISKKNLQILKELHPESEFIVYHWDSVANNHNALNLLPLFDRKYSFDRFDCEKFGIKFLPLFFYDKYSEIDCESKNAKYDLMFVGTTHSDRYSIVKSITEQFKAKGKSSFVYFFFQGRIMFYKYLLENKESRDIDRATVHFSSMPKDTLLDLYQDSRIIVDVNHPKQTGLTLRCMETLGAHRKLITTNEDIRHYDFYDNRNICIINRNNPEVKDDFINEPYHQIKDTIYNKYSLSSWIDTILEISKHDNK